MRLPSLRLRLLWGASVWVSVALVAVGILLFELFHNYATEDVFDDLSNQQDQLLAGISVGADGGLAVGPVLSDPRFERPYSGLYWQVDSQGRSGLLRSRSLWDFVMDMPRGMPPADGEQHRHRVKGPKGEELLAVERIVSLPDYAEPLLVVVALDASRLDEAIRNFRQVLMLSFVVLGLGLIGAAALQVFIGLRPLSLLRTRLGLLRDGESARLEGGFPSEVQPLVDDLNALLAHQAQVVERGRLLAGNLAHGLKTPLAVAANEIERLEETGEADAPLIRAQLERMQRQVDHHTARARAAASSARPGQRCPVAEVAQPLAGVVERLNAGRALSLTLDVPADAAFRGERQDLEEMLGNLLDNAAKWGKGRILLSCRGAERGWLELAVEDDGPGLAAELREDAFERGRRHDTAVPGTGLGLGIVRDLAELYGGSVRLESSRELGGLKAVLRLPAPWRRA
ncbi:MAG TPA: HAMP domain-containing sensor histidine kinase [Candidatus Sulfotelmatobacter sp.]|jgi:signal transduction histidine kinase|nr:HAMP domain-containing sensor histidine kinase [Candidatus Sulfotelmatobacter sp.]